MNYSLGNQQKCTPWKCHRHITRPTKRPFTTMDNLESPINLTPIWMCFITVGRRRSPWRKPTQTQWEHADSTQKGPIQTGIRNSKKGDSAKPFFHRTVEKGFGDSAKPFFHSSVRWHPQHVFLCATNNPKPKRIYIFIICLLITKTMIYQDNSLSWLRFKNATLSHFPLVTDGTGQRPVHEPVPHVNKERRMRRWAPRCTIT